MKKSTGMDTDANSEGATDPELLFCEDAQMTQLNFKEKLCTDYL